MDVTVAQVESSWGEFVWATVVSGEPYAKSLLVVTALESVDIEVDPPNQTPKRLPAVWLKRLREICGVD